jgi:N-methylhydantoinase B
MTAVLDPVTLAVVEHSLVEITREMDAVLERTAFTPVISEARDRASGIYSVTGEVIAQGPSGLPLFISTMGETVKSVINGLPDMRPGDVAIINDPYVCGTHLMDVRLVAPFFYEGELLFYLADTGHWTDVGGMAPGSFCVAAREIQQEGVRIPPVRLIREGVLQEDVLTLILANLRIPTNARGDLQAQLGALTVGERRLREHIDKYGRDVVLASVAEMRVRGERAMRSRIAEIPDGRYEGESYLDNDGIDPEPMRVHVVIDVAGDELRCDFSGSSGLVRGPLNTALPTTEAGVYIGLKHLFPDVPMNAGCFEPVEIDVPTTTFLNAGYPKAVSGCSAEVSGAVADAVMRALAGPLPDLVPAGPYRTMAAFTLGGVDPDTGRPYVLFSFNGGGYGATSTGDGLTNAPLAIGIAKAPPAEIMESQYPILYERYAIREGSGGDGQYRGGLGCEYEVRLLRGEALSAALMNNGFFAPWGANGGTDGALTELEYRLRGERFVPPLKTKVDGVEMRAGDALVLRTPGGGGWGPPEQRDPAAAARDVELGYVSEES